MALSHLPTRFRAYSRDVWGLTSAAEGFVLLAAFLSGYLHLKRARTRGFPAIRKHLFTRAFKLYQAHLAVFALALAVRHARHQAPALERWFWFHIEQPMHALAGATTLLYCPSLFDILPMYIVFLTATPFILELGERRGFGGALLVSTLLWGASQCGLVDYVRVTGAGLFGVPAAEMGAFQWCAWQLLWVIGLWLGASAARERDAAPARIPGWALALAFSLCAACLALRYGLLDLDLEQNLPHAVDKWRLGPLRIANLFCLGLLALHFGPRVARLSVMEMFSRLGRESLRVFLVHLVMCVLIALWVDELRDTLSLAQELAIVGATLFAMTAAAFSRAELRRLVTLGAG